MLKNIDPLLTPDLLKVLAEMGHDDAIVLADANFTAMSLGAGKPVLRLPGIGMARAVQAVASVLPLAQDVPHPVAYMQVGGTEAPYRSALQREALAHFLALRHWLICSLLVTEAWRRSAALAAATSPASGPDGPPAMNDDTTRRVWAAPQSGQGGAVVSADDIIRGYSSS